MPLNKETKRETKPLFLTQNVNWQKEMTPLSSVQL